MSLSLKLSILFLLLCSGLASATPPSAFKQDIDRLKYALRFSSAPKGDLHEFLNPYQGLQQFRLASEEAPWAGNYFPMQSGGIANQWQRGFYPEFVLDRDTLVAMSPKDLQKLSPIEKFDILLGQYSFPGTLHELYQRGPFRDPYPEDWEGFCNGARCAGLLLPEPQHLVVRTNTDGIPLSFTPADLKALASASYFFTEKYAQIGEPTVASFAENQPNPAIFDLTLRYFLAHNKKGFIIDSHLGSELWNETVVGYHRQLSEGYFLNEEEMTEHPQAAKKILIEVELETLGEVDIKKSNRQTKAKVASGEFLSKMNVSYFLYLDNQNKSVGGQWLNENSLRGIDFIWFAGGKGTDSHFEEKGGNPYLPFDTLFDLIRESAQPRCAKLFTKL